MLIQLDYGKPGFRTDSKGLAGSVEALSGSLTVDGKDTIKQAYDSVFSKVGEAVGDIGKTSATALQRASKVCETLRSRLLKALDANAQPGGGAVGVTTPQPHPTVLQGIMFAKEYQNEPGYWRDLHQAAGTALSLCERLLQELTTASTSCSKINKESSHADILTALNALQDANGNVATLIRQERALNDAARWCRTVMHREIAHASADNVTEFDPSELVQAISVAARCDLITTPLQVSDALSKALLGTQKDGSWRLGRPFFSPDHVLGMWPGTSESVWALMSAVQVYPDVTVADKALFRYLKWLERTQVVIRQAETKLAGWPADRLGTGQTIHLPTTAFSINAVLEIRDLVEYRLWQLCQKRFTAVPVHAELSDIDPVDLGQPHGQRLHGRLYRMATHTQGSGFAKAPYSLVLHGPPGSSKTKLAEALSVAMWKDSSRWGARRPRFIRVTPADFTRMGEDRLDSEARLIFELLSHVRGVTIFFDEIDDLLRSRSTVTKRPSFMELVVPAMLNRLADLRAACPRQEICFLLATNYVDNIEPALLREGRIDLRLPVVYPDEASRRALLHRHLEDMRRNRDPSLAQAVEGRALTIITHTKGWPWMAIDQLLKDLLNEAANAAASGHAVEEYICGFLQKNIKDFKPRHYLERFKRDRGKSLEFANELVAVCHSHPTHDTQEALGFSASSIEGGDEKDALKEVLKEAYLGLQKKISANAPPEVESGGRGNRSGETAQPGTQVLGPGGATDEGHARPE